MILRGFYIARTHLVNHVVQWVPREYDGCTFRSPVATMVRTKCDQFLANDDVPLVILAGETAPTCADCRERLRIDAVAAAVDAD